MVTSGYFHAERYSPHQATRHNSTPTHKHPKKEEKEELSWQDASPLGEALWHDSTQEEGCNGHSFIIINTIQPSGKHTEVARVQCADCALLSCLPCSLHPPPPGCWASSP
jgi:hypothetical protein